jgi:hypothetical protein
MVVECGALGGLRTGKDNPNKKTTNISRFEVFTAMTYL